MYNFSEEQLQRYSRHIILDDIGIEGQQKLLDSSVLIVGVGGLGAPAGLYAAASGIGKIGIVDADLVELSNLQRQVIHFSDDIGKSKVSSAAEKMKNINPQSIVVSHEERLTADNAQSLFEQYDFVIDGTDNFSSKFLINDAAHFTQTPYSHGGVLRFQGQTMTVLPGKSTCYRCVFKEPPAPNSVPSCSQAGVVGAVAGIIGTIQITEAIKYFTGVGDLITDRIVTVDAKSMEFRSVPVPKQDSCSLCGSTAVITSIGEEPEHKCVLGQ